MAKPTIDSLANHARVHLWMLLVLAWPLVLRLPLLAFESSVARSILVMAAWLWGLHAIVWPFYFGPHSHLPLAPGHTFALGHGLAVIESPPGKSCLGWAQTPNPGLMRLAPLFFWGHRLLVCSPDAVSQVLNTHAYDYEKPKPPKEFLERLLGQGLIVSEGSQHKAQRKIVWPAFQGHHIKQLAPTFWAKSLEFTDVLAASILKHDPLSASRCRHGVVEMSAIASRATLDIIGIAGIGKNFNTLQDSTDELADLFSTLTDPSHHQILQCFLMHVFLPRIVAENLPLQANRIVTSSAARLRRICLDFIAEKKQHSELAADGPKDILSVLLLSGALSETELVDQLLTFLAAGHETTASALTWSAYLLAVNPTVQQRLRQEIQSTVPTHTRPGDMTADLLDSMPFLAAVCNESLRLYATVPITSRVALKDTMIGDTVVPKDTLVVLAASAINRLPVLWGKDSCEFNPDRWMEDGQSALGGSKSPYSQITFLHGARSCIGQSFAKLELKALIAALISRFSLEMEDPNADVEPAGVITIKPRKVCVMEIGHEGLSHQAWSSH